MEAAPITKLRTAALLLTDGHFSIFKFTTGWRVALGTIEGREAISNKTYHGPTLDAAVEKLLDALKSPGV